MSQKLQTEKQSVMLVPQKVTHGATATANLDCKGHRSVDITVAAGALDGGTSGTAPKEVKLTESDDTVVTNFATFAAGATVTTLGASQSVRFNVDLRGRKRYIRLSFTPQTNNTNDAITMAAIARFDRSESDPASTSGLGDNIVKIL
jgi:hypothetical protein